MEDYRFVEKNSETILSIESKTLEYIRNSEIIIYSCFALQTWATSFSFVIPKEIPTQILLKMVDRYEAKKSLGFVNADSFPANFDGVQEEVTVCVLGGERGILYVSFY